MIAISKKCKINSLLIRFKALCKQTNLCIYLCAYTRIHTQKPIPKLFNILERLPMKNLSFREAHVVEHIFSDTPKVQQFGLI